MGSATFILIFIVKCLRSYIFTKRSRTSNFWLNILWEIERRLKSSLRINKAVNLCFLYSDMLSDFVKEKENGLRYVVSASN